MVIVPSEVVISTVGAAHAASDMSRPAASVERDVYKRQGQGIDLILHQCNQRRDDDGTARAEQGGNLVAQALAAAGRHQKDVYKRQPCSFAVRLRFADPRFDPSNAALRALNQAPRYA